MITWKCKGCYSCKMPCGKQQDIGPKDFPIIHRAEIHATILKLYDIDDNLIAVINTREGAKVVN